MTTRTRRRTHFFLASATMAALALAAAAGDLPAELPRPDGKAPDHFLWPVKVYILSGQSNMVGMGNPASLEPLAKADKKFQYPIDESGKWTVRNDVFFVDITNARIASWLTVGLMNKGKTLGPEAGIGHVLG